MSPNLDADDIARITASVLEKLGDRKVDAASLSRAVQDAATRSDEPAPAHTPVKSGSDLPFPTQGEHSRIILASFGLNRPGIVASISAVLAESGCSIADMSQRVMQEFYTLIMIVDISGSTADFAALSEMLKAVEERLGVTIFVQHEDVFRFMHRV